MIPSLSPKEIKIGVVGLGYVGLPLAVEFGFHFDVVGLDVSTQKISELQQGVDTNGEVSTDDLNKSSVKYTSDATELNSCNVIIVTVPTPIDSSKNPDLTPLKSASKAIGQQMQAKSIIVYESTVYPGLTEDICAPILEAESGLVCGKDFFLGYSPERMNPGDRDHHVTKIKKVVAGQTAEVTQFLGQLYGTIVTAGIHEASSIKVAEAAKVIENTQRDLNIALMNELSIIFNRIGINTREVIEAAATKWNFNPFFPGLVGGHCIGVDPYYLTHAAEQQGYHPQVILAGRRINDGMGKFIAEQTIKRLIRAHRAVTKSTLLVLGITFKENVSDIRNTRVVDIISELKDYGVKVMLHDPYASSNQVKHEYGLTLVNIDDIQDLDGVIVANAHDAYLSHSFQDNLIQKLKTPAVVMDIKGCFKTKFSNQSQFEYWQL